MDLGVLDNVMDAFDAATFQWSTLISPYALTLFYYLAVIEWAWSFLVILLSRQASVETVLKTVILKVFYFSFLFWLIQKAYVLFPIVITSFQRVGGAASGLTALHPSAFLNNGLRSAIAIIASLDLAGLLLDPFGRTIAFWGAFSSLVLHCLIAAAIMLTLIESFIVIGGVVQFMLAFAASRWTAPLSHSALATVFRTGVKLMVTYLVAGVFNNLTQQWSDTLVASTVITPLDVLTFIGALLVACVLIFILPNKLASYLVPPTLQIGLTPLIQGD